MLSIFVSFPATLILFPYLFLWSSASFLKKDIPETINRLKLLSIYSGLTQIDRINFVHFVALSDVGVKMYLPLNFLPRNPNLNFLIFHRTIYLSSVEKSDYTRRTWDPHRTFQSRWGLGMIFDF